MIDTILGRGSITNIAQYLGSFSSTFMLLESGSFLTRRSPSTGHWGSRFLLPTLAYTWRLWDSQNRICPESWPCGGSCWTHRPGLWVDQASCRCPTRTHTTRSCHRPGIWDKQQHFWCQGILDDIGQPPKIVLNDFVCHHVFPEMASNDYKISIWAYIWLYFCRNTTIKSIEDGLSVEIRL